MTLKTDLMQSSSPEPIRTGEGASIAGPRNPAREKQSPDLVCPPETDHGALSNLRFSFADAYNRLEEGGWAR